MGVMRICGGRGRLGVRKIISIGSKDRKGRNGRNCNGGGRCRDQSDMSTRQATSQGGNSGNVNGSDRCRNHRNGYRHVACCYGISGRSYVSGTRRRC